MNLADGMAPLATASHSAFAQMRGSTARAIFCEVRKCGVSQPIKNQDPGAGGPGVRDKSGLKFGFQGWLCRSDWSEILNCASSGCF